MRKRFTLALWTASLSLPLAAAPLTVTVLDRDGKPLPGAVVIVETHETGARPTPPAEVRIEQEGMKFRPAVSIAHLSSKVRFANLDRWPHHVRGGLVTPAGVFVDPSQGYSFRLEGRAAGKPAASLVRRYTQTGPQLLGCHLHASMAGHLYVTDSPWASVTGPNGQASWQDIPPGAARVRVWHADGVVEIPSAQVQVSAGGSQLSVPTVVAPRKPTESAPSSGYSY